MKSHRELLQAHDITGSLAPAGTPRLSVPGTPVDWQSGVSGNWNNAANWSGDQVPDASSDVTVSVAGTYTVTINSAATAQSLTLDNATAFIVDDAALSLAGSLALAAGTFTLGSSGSITGGTLSAAQGAKFRWKGGTLSADTYQGKLTVGGHMDLTLDNGTAVTGADGTGKGEIVVWGKSSVLNVDGAVQAGTVTVDGAYASLNLYGANTLNHTRLNLGARTGTYGSDLNFFNASGGAGTLTLGSGLRLDLTGRGTTITGGVLVNQDQISVTAANGAISFSAAVTNESTISVSGAATSFDLLGNLSNQGSLAASNGSTLILGDTNNPGSDSLTNTGVISVSGSSSELLLNGTETTAQLGIVQNNGGLVANRGTLNNVGATLTLGAGSSLGAIELNSLGFGNLDNLGGVIDGGTINADSSGDITGSSTYPCVQDGADDLLNVTYNIAGGTLNLNASNSEFGLTGTTTLTGGQGGDVINLSGQSNALFLSGTVNGLKMLNLTSAGATLWLQDVGVNLLQTEVNRTAGEILLTGTLTNTGSTLSVGAGSQIGQLELGGVGGSFNGTILGGVVADGGNGLVGNVLLSGVAYEATALDIGSADGWTLDGGTTVTGVGGSGTGTINNNGGQLTLNQDLAGVVINSDSGYIYSTGTTFANTTINFSGAGKIIATAGTLTFGSSCVVNQSSGATATIGAAGVDPTPITNLGTINANAAGGLLTVDASGSYNGASVFTNQGTFDISNGDTVAIKYYNYGLNGPPTATFDNTGMLTLSGAGSAIDMQGGWLDSSAALTLVTGTSLFGNGEVQASILDNGTITAAMGEPISYLYIDGAVTGNGLLQVDTGAALELGGAAASQETMNWIGSGGQLVLDDATQFSSTINDFAGGDVIVLSNLAATSAKIVGSQLDVKLSNGSSLTFNLTNTPQGETVKISGSGHTLTSTAAGAMAPNGMLSSGFLGDNSSPHAEAARFAQAVDFGHLTWADADFAAAHMAGITTAAWTIENMFAPALTSGDPIAAADMHVWANVAPQVHA